MSASPTYQDFGLEGLPIDAPAAFASVVVPSDTADLSRTTRSLYVGGAGNVTVDLRGGDQAVTFVGVPAGTFLPLRVTRVRQTGTSATNILALR